MYNLINIEVQEEVREKNIRRCREKGIVLPTFAQMVDPSKTPQQIKEKLKNIGLWDVKSENLFRVNWRNDPTDFGGGFGEANYIEIPRSITGVKARILALAGKWFPTGCHKVGATYACLAPALATGNFDATSQQAVWPSTGNYCRGGAYISALLGCQSIAILPEQMSRERFDWLKHIAGEVIATPGCESNVKEIFDKCHELEAQRGSSLVIFNQFDQFGNYLWHYTVTGASIADILAKLGVEDERIRAYASSTGSAGTIAAGDYLKNRYPAIKIAAGEALQCPTLLRNGFGGHRIEGIGDKHVPWIHNVKNTDVIVDIDDQDCMDVFRLFNEPAGLEYLESIGVPDADIENLRLFGISGIGNMIQSIKLAKYYEMDEDDVVFTILTDSAAMYTSRLAELEEQQGPFTRDDAIKVHAASLLHQGIDHMAELGYYDRQRVHNLKYYTWVEQQGKTYDEIKAQWYERDYWKQLPSYVAKIDELIEYFNKRVGIIE